MHLVYTKILSTKTKCLPIRQMPLSTKCQLRRYRPLEIVLIISNFLGLEDLRSMALTCRYMNTALDSMLYKHAIATGVYVGKFVYAAIWGRTSAISKFLKAGVLMTAFGKVSLFS